MTLYNTQQQAIHRVSFDYNPLTVCTNISITNRNTDQQFDCLKLQELVQNNRLSRWIDSFFNCCFQELNVGSLDFYFQGTDLDVDDVEMAFQAFQADAKSASYTATLTVERFAVTIDQKLNDLHALYAHALQGPIHEFKEAQATFDAAIDTVFEVYVVATMSSGKSTVINALLGQRLMPAKNAACTAVISKIFHKPDAQAFQARRLDDQGQVIGEWGPIDYSTMEAWNADVITHTIEIEGCISEAFNRSSVQLVLIDTPGPNNSQDESHQKIMYDAIESERPSMILYILNATQLGINDDAKLLASIQETMRKGGRQVQDRFVFLLNKMDEIDPEKESPLSIIENAKTYLQSKGIYNPQVIPVSALNAKMARLSQSNPEALTATQKRMLRLQQETVLDSNELDMLSYVTDVLGSSSLAKLKQRVQDMTDDHLRFDMMTGIPVVEQLLNDYLSKHAVPMRLNDAVGTFKRVTQSMAFLNEINQLIQADHKELERLTQNIETFKQDAVRLEAAQFFRMKIHDYTFDDDLFSLKARINAELNRELIDQIDDYENDHSTTQFKQFVESLHGTFIRLTSKVESDCSLSVRASAQTLMDHFFDSYTSKCQELLSHGIDKDDAMAQSLMELKKVALALPPIEDLVAKVTYQRTEVIKKSPVWYNPLSWLKRGQTISLTQERINLLAFKTEYTESVYAYVDRLIQETIESSKATVNAIKEVYLQALDEVDARLNELQLELATYITDEVSKQEKINENKYLLSWFNDFQARLDAILDIKGAPSCPSTTSV